MTDRELLISQPHAPAGYLVICDGFRVAAYRKPGLVHRVVMRLLLGWKWETA